MRNVSIKPASATASRPITKPIMAQENRNVLLPPLPPLRLPQFNVSVREEAEKTFPPHVACKGVHQLAFRFVGRRYQSKLAPDLRESDVQAFLKDRLGGEVSGCAGAAQGSKVNPIKAM